MWISKLSAETAAGVMALCWLGFGIILILGRSRSAKSDKKRDATSHLGFLLQCAGYGICFVFHRPYFSPMASSEILGMTISIAAIAIAIASEWLTFAAAMTLGKQWALVARVVEGHELVERGPYGLVRNPIYLAMLGMLIATGSAISYWQALLAALVVFLFGNGIRIRSEERLLREAFGSKFDDYARRVPAVFPRIL
jgi:protein-S-isoprenylcysteine O-methyltransferase Ste14